jgi:flagellar FliJ protein
MKNSKSIDRVRDMAEGRAQSLAGEVGALLREKEDAHRMLQRLSEYASEYSSGGAADGRVSVSAIENRHRFVTRLNSALEQQRSRARSIEERADHKMISWRRACADVEALNRLASRREQDMAREEEKRVQRDADAIALRQFNRGSRRETHGG